QHHELGLRALRTLVLVRRRALPGGPDEPRAGADRVRERPVGQDGVLWRSRPNLTHPCRLSIRPGAASGDDVESRLDEGPSTVRAGDAPRRRRALAGWRALALRRARAARPARRSARAV